MPCALSCDCRRGLGTTRLAAPRQRGCDCRVDEDSDASRGSPSRARRFSIGRTGGPEKFLCGHAQNNAYWILGARPSATIFAFGEELAGRTHPDTWLSCRMWFQELARIRTHLAHGQLGASGPQTARTAHATPVAWGAVGALELLARREFPIFPRFEPWKMPIFKSFPQVFLFSSSPKVLRHGTAAAPIWSRSAWLPSRPSRVGN